MTIMVVAMMIGLVLISVPVFANCQSAIPSVLVWCVLWVKGFVFVFCRWVFVGLYFISIAVYSIPGP